MEKDFINVKYVADNDLCNSCGFCEPVCPEKAIKIQFNDFKGYHEPVINEELCKKCGKCLDVCQGYEVDFPSLNKIFELEEPEEHQIGNMRNFMILYSSDLEIRKNAASGGVITHLIIYLFEQNEIQGAYVARPSKTDPFEPEGYIARNKEELMDSQMSIYNSVPFGRSINQLNEFHGKILFVGLPCQTHALLKYIQIYPEVKDKIYGIIGTFCGGYQISNAHKYYFPSIGVNFDDMQYIDYRYGDFPGQLNIGFKDGTHKEFKRRFKSKWEKNHYNTAFNSSFYVPRCYTCADKGNIFADISVGDPWLPRFQDEKIGKSLIVTRTKFGENLIDRAIKAGVLINEPAAFKDIMDVQKLDRERHGNQIAYQKFFKLFRKPYPKYKFLGKNEILNKRIYFRVLTDYLRIKLQRRKNLWYILHPLYVIDKHIRNIFVFSNPIKYFLNRLKK